MAMSSTPIIEVTFDGYKFTQITKAAGNINIISCIIGEEFEHDIKEFGGTQKVCMYQKINLSLPYSI